MAFDGIVISNVVSDMKKYLIDGRIYKIYQPEKDELNIVIKNNRENYRLLMSADASLPLIYLQQSAKENPMTAPNFCMLSPRHYYWNTFYLSRYYYNESYIHTNHLYILFYK